MKRKRKKSEKNVVFFFSSWLERVNEGILVAPRSTESFLPKEYRGRKRLTKKNPCARQFLIFIIPN